MSLFDEYNSEYNDLVKRTGELTAELLSSNPFSQDAHTTAADAIEKTLVLANDVVKQMEIHARSLRKPQNRCDAAAMVKLALSKPGIPNDHLLKWMHSQYTSVSQILQGHDIGTSKGLPANA